MSFRANLQYLRAQRHMPQEQLAMLLGVSRQAISKWESEKAYPEMDKLLMICDLFGAYRNFCGALDWFSLSVGGVGVSRGGVEFVPVDAGPVCGRDAVVRFGRRCLFALPQGVGDE